MKIGVQTAPILDNLGIDEGFRLIHEAGFDCVDFNIDHCMTYREITTGEFSGFFDQSMDDILKATAPYKEAAEKYGVTFAQAHAPFPTYVKDKPQTNERVLDALKKCVEICAYVGCPHLIVHPAFCPYEDRLDPETEWDINIKMYSALIPVLKKCHVTCCLENMFTGHKGKIYEAICSDFNEAAAYIDELNDLAGEDCFGFCLDTGHALLLGHDIYTAIMQVGERIKALHIHDNDGRDDLHIAPYTGILDWNRFIAGMRDSGFRGVLSFETFNACNKVDQELYPEMLKLIAATGRMFSRRIEG
ncbi:MAG: sugar phosphate isomerase/epimerase [Clostridia bacterium]|nr:sugar phosphate isomerase/epimerase [Clostridia bacterium]